MSKKTLDTIVLANKEAALNSIIKHTDFKTVCDVLDNAYYATSSSLYTHPITNSIKSIKYEHILS